MHLAVGTYKVLVERNPNSQFLLETSYLSKGTYVFKSRVSVPFRCMLQFALCVKKYDPLQPKDTVLGTFSFHYAFEEARFTVSQRSGALSVKEERRSRNEDFGLAGDVVIEAGWMEDFNRFFRSFLVMYWKAIRSAVQTQQSIRRRPAHANASHPVSLNKTT